MKEVEDKLGDIDPSDRDRYQLRKLYETMLEKGSDRILVNPSESARFTDLYRTMPNFKEPLDDVRRAFALSRESAQGFEIMPLLLLGPPGIGKTYFASCIAKLISTEMKLVSMATVTGGFLLSGSSPQWRGSKPGHVFDALVKGKYGNPIIVIDEIDKASGDSQYDPLGSLYSLLEQDTASIFIDEFAEVAVNASKVIWITTANYGEQIPKPILSRMTCYEIPPPDIEASRIIATNLYSSIRAEKPWGANFEEAPSEDVIDLMSRMTPRNMKQVWVRAFGDASIRNSSKIETFNIRPQKEDRVSIGFR